MRRRIADGSPGTLGRMTGPSHAAPRPPHGRLARLFVAVSATLALVVAAGSTYGFVAYYQAGHKGVVKWGKDGSSQPSGVAVGPCAKNVCNYLLLGSDSRKGLSPDQIEHFGNDQQIGGENRADTIMLVHTDPDLQKAIILSFPRDLWVNIPGHGYDKINAAFSGGVDHGGPLLVARTVHALTGLRINHFLYVDLAGFEGVVKTLGGVDMCISAENVNTPGYVADANGQSTYYSEPGHIVDPNTGLDVTPGCQRLPADQALAYVRTRHLPCDAAAPDFFRIGRQQQFMRAVINRLLQPSELLKLPTQIGPILGNMKRDPDLNPADLAYLVGQLRGISTGAAEFRAVPGYGATSSDGLSIIKMDPAASEIFKAISSGKQLGDAGTRLVNTPISEANIAVPVVDHASAGKVDDVAQVLADSGFDISPGVVTYADYGADLPGNVIAYKPGHLEEANVVAKYFPGLKLVESKELGATPVALFITASYRPVQPGAGGTAGACVDPNA